MARRRRLCFMCSGGRWTYVQLFARDVFRCRDCGWQVALTREEAHTWRSAMLASDAAGLQRLHDLFHFLDGDADAHAS